MKKYLFLLGLMVLLLINGCSQGSNVSKMILVSGYDFTSYTEKGFLFTPEQYLGDYDAVGLLTLEIIPDVERIPYGTRETDEGWEILIGITRYWKVREISPEEVLDSLYKKAVTMGADALVRFNIEAPSHYNGDVYFNGLEASGFAIKRKGSFR